MGAVNTNFVVKSEANTTITNLINSQIFDNGTNVGIGTTSPGNNLEIRTTSATAGGISLVTTANTTGDGPIITFGRASVAANLATIRGARDGASGGTLRLSTADTLTTAITERMRITSAGNVGIGTTSPGALLHVQTETSAEIARFRSMGANSVADMVLVNDAQTWGFRVDGGNSDSFFIRDFQSSNNRLTITTSGNVGIGTTDPPGRLHLTQAHSNTVPVFSIGESSNFERFKIIQETSYAGIVIGDSNVDLKLKTKAGGGTGGTMSFWTSTSGDATERLRITSAGNVGIGTTDPAGFKLNVNGTIFSAGSSIEYKEDINDYKTDTEKLMLLKPVTYMYKQEYAHLGKPLVANNQIGLIAEQVAEVFPELAITKKENDKNIVRNVDYEKLSILLLSEMQKLITEVNQLKKSHNLNSQP